MATGNRNFDTGAGKTTTLPGSFNPDIYNPSINTTDNRFAAGQGYSYDAAGNTTEDAERKWCQVCDSAIFVDVAERVVSPLFCASHLSAFRSHLWALRVSFVTLSRLIRVPTGLTSALIRLRFAVLPRPHNKDR